MNWHMDDPLALGRLRKILRDRYPTLHVRMRGDFVHVEGTFAALTEDAHEDRYAINVRLPADYPRSIPSIWETAGRIERNIDRHVFPATGALCVGVPVELWINLKGDFCIENYLEKAVRPYLIGNSLFEEGQPWPFSQSSHGSYGVLEFYERHLGTRDSRVVGRFLLDLLKGKVKGHWPCPCGSGQPLRKCHGEQVNALKNVPAGALLDSVDHMLNLLRAAHA